MRVSSSSADSLGPSFEFVSKLNEGSLPRPFDSLVCSYPAVVRPVAASSSDADCNEICPAERVRFCVVPGAMSMFAPEFEFIRPDSPLELIGSVERPDDG